jgi:hypothetical protein
LNKIIKKNQAKKLLKKQLLNKRKLQQNRLNKHQEFQNKKNHQIQSQLKNNKKGKNQMDSPISKIEMIKRKTIYQGKLYLT